MDSHTFRAFVQDAQHTQLEVMGAKSKEYSTNADKFANFRRGARRTGLSPAQVVDAWQSKHDVSIEMITDGTIRPTPAMLQEKFTDSINYLYMKWALLLEECDDQGE